MNRPLRTLLVVIVVLALLVVFVPLVIPLPPLADTAPISELADPDSRFITVNGIQVHYKQYGSGEPVMILLHGFGASVFSWREVLQPLGQIGTVIAYDRPAFGLTERPLPGSWQGANPYGVQGNLDLLFGLMDSLGVSKAILVGNSSGGRLAVQAALAQPQRVSGLVLVDPAIYTGGGQRFGLLAPIVNTPQMDRIGPILTRGIAGDQGTQFLQTAWHDPSKITEAITAGYRKPLRVADWDIALWQFTKAGTGDEDLAPRLSELRMPVLVAAGDDDRIVPTADSVRLGGDIPGAKLEIFPACGHVPQEECPAAFLQPVEAFMRQFKP
ncbi:MAG TPA: alpha/beta hydrolase [Anaerolinea sp.]|nr:alpha/beta hydrolase [Anaerolinea sp.]